MDRIQEWIQEKGAKTAVVCGAGFIGVEMAEQLKHRGMDVYLVEAIPQIMAPFDVEMAAILEKELQAHGITVLTDSVISSFEPSQVCTCTYTFVTDANTHTQLEHAHTHGDNRL